MSEPTDPEAVKALACAVVENAVHYATSDAATVRDAEREDAVRFLTDASDPRLDRWCAALDVDPDAIRDGIRHRLREVLDDAA